MDAPAKPEYKTARCRCQGNNAHCHMCFGSGEITPGAPEFTGGQPRNAQYRAFAPPTPKARPTDLRSMLNDQAGFTLIKELDTIFAALARSEKEGDPRLATFLQKSLLCPKPTFRLFVRELHLAILNGQGKALDRSCARIGRLLSQGGVEGGISSEFLKDLVTARLAHVRRHREAEVRAQKPGGPAPAPTPPKNAPKANKRKGWVLQPIAPVAIKASPDATRRNDVRAAVQPEQAGAVLFRPVRQDPAAPRTIVLTSSGNPREERLDELGSLLRGISSANVYAGVPKKVIRQLAARFPGLDVTHVRNAGNLERIRKNGDALAFDLD